MSDTTYADGTYGANSETSRDLERDQHAAFTDQQAAVLALAYDAAATGITGHDVQQATGWGDSSKSRALSNLLRDGKLVRLAEKRDRGFIHVLPEHVNGRDIEPYVSLAEKHYDRGLEHGMYAGVSEGLDRAFTVVDNSDSISDALITLRRLIQARQP